MGEPGCIPQTGGCPQQSPALKARAIASAESLMTLRHAAASVVTTSASHVSPCALGFLFRERVQSPHALRPGRSRLVPQAIYVTPDGGHR